MNTILASLYYSTSDRDRRWLNVVILTTGTFVYNNSLHCTQFRNPGGGSKCRITAVVGGQSCVYYKLLYNEHCSLNRRHIIMNHAYFTIYTLLTEHIAQYTQSNHFYPLHSRHGLERYLADPGEARGCSTNSFVINQKCWKKEQCSKA